MIVSDIESEEYGKHYGTQRYNYIAAGQGLSDAIVLKGRVRGIYDTFICNHDIPIYHNILCWRFGEPVTLLSGAVRIITATFGSKDMRADLYDGDTSESNLKGEVFDNFHTFEAHGRRGFSQHPYITNISQGYTLAFSSSEGTVLSGVEVGYNLTFMTES